MTKCPSLPEQLPEMRALGTKCSRLGVPPFLFRKGHAPGHLGTWSKRLFQK
jgi:hypothetical protein